MKDAADRVRLGWPEVGEEELAEIAAVIETGWLTMGPKVAEFEDLLARACGTEHAVAVSSGTAALHLGVIAAGIGPGDEVIVPAYTFPATANVVRLVGATPVLVDVDPVTMNLDVEQAAAAVTPRTKAVLGVHLFGRPLAWDDLRAAIPDRVFLLEDAAGALGARSRGRRCGSLGLLGCLSFHPRKTVTTGEGGAVTTSDQTIADSVRGMRHHGWRPPQYADMPIAGLNYRLADVLCALGIPQVRRLDAMLESRARTAAGYEERLAGLPVTTPRAGAGDEHGWQAYVVQVDNRDTVLAGLRERGVEAQIGTYAVHLLSAYADQGPFPGAVAAFERALALPFHTRLTESDLDRVAETLTDVVSDR